MGDSNVGARNAFQQLGAKAGIGVFFIDAGLKIGIVGQIAGIGLGYTIVFVSIPLIISGVLFILSGRTFGKSAKKDN